VAREVAKSRPGAYPRRRCSVRVWFSMSLGDAMFADDERSRIEASFRSAFTDAGGPSEMALFIRHESEGRLHCEVKIYFSPAALLVALHLGFLSRDFGMKALIESFHEAIEKRSSPPIPYREVALTARIMDAIFDQIRTSMHEIQKGD